MEPAQLIHQSLGEGGTSCRNGEEKPNGVPPSPRLRGAGCRGSKENGRLGEASLPKSGTGSYRLHPIQFILLIPSKQIYFPDGRRVRHLVME